MPFSSTLATSGGSSVSSARPISRNLTSSFMKARHERRFPGGRKDAHMGRRLPCGVEDDMRTSLACPEVRIEMSLLPPQWVDAAEEAREDIRTLKEKLGVLHKAQQKRLLKVFGDNGVPDKEVEACSHQISSVVRHCEQQIHEVKNRGEGGGGRGDEEHRHNVQRHLATQLQQLSQQFRQNQKEYMQEIRKRQKGSFWEETPCVSRPPLVADVGLSCGHMRELESMQINAAQRNEEICQIAKSVSDLNTIFKELAVLVIDQGSILDRIDYNIEQVVNDSEQANDELRTAEKSQKSQGNRARNCMLILVVVNLVFLIILILRSRH